MNVDLQLSTDDAKVLDDAGPDRAVLNATVTVHHHDDDFLVVAPEEIRFDLVDENGNPIEELHRTDEGSHGARELKELKNGESAQVSVPLAVRNVDVRPDTPYGLACHAFGRTEHVPIKFL